MICLLPSHHFPDNNFDYKFLHAVIIYLNYLNDSLQPLNLLTNSILRLQQYKAGKRYLCFIGWYNWKTTAHRLENILHYHSNQWPIFTLCNLIHHTLISCSMMLSLDGDSGSFMISSNRTDCIWRSLNSQIYPLVSIGSWNYTYKNPTYSK